MSNVDAALVQYFEKIQQMIPSLYNDVTYIILNYACDDLLLRIIPESGISSEITVPDGKCAFWTINHKNENTINICIRASRLFDSFIS